METISFTIQSIGEQSFNVNLPANSPTSELAKIIETHLGSDIDPATVKLFYRAKILHLEKYSDLAAAGITNGSKIKLMASSKSAIKNVQEAHEPLAMPTFEHEEQREHARQSKSTSPTSSTQTRFSRLEEWNLPRLSPPPSQARALLHRLASDPGINGVMHRHGWRVGLLSEMPPEGKVGISPVCLLGFNMNKGAEISLRLRTDDLKGFRKYDSIRLTLIHELAHMVHSEHNTAFKELNSQLKREVAELDWQSAPGARTVGLVGVGVGGAPTLALGQARAATAEVTGAGGRVGGSLLEAGVAARDAAATAALRRANASTITSFPIEIEPEKKEIETTAAQQQPLKKGDDVLYQQRDGTWVPAKIVAVDVSVQPPSYGIELPTADGGNYRETELHRLRAAPPVNLEERANGSGGEYTPHYDPQTEATEAEVHRRFE
jgi:hypothetical protein